MFCVGCFYIHTTENMSFAEITNSLCVIYLPRRLNILKTVLTAGEHRIQTITATSLVKGTSQDHVMKALRFIYGQGEMQAQLSAELHHRLWMWFRLPV